MLIPKVIPKTKASIHCKQKSPSVSPPVLSLRYSGHFEVHAMNGKHFMPPSIPKIIQTVQHILFSFSKSKSLGMLPNPLVSSNTHGNNSPLFTKLLSLLELVSFPLAVRYSLRTELWMTVGKRDSWCTSQPAP